MLRGQGAGIPCRSRGDSPPAPPTPDLGGLHRQSPTREKKNPTRAVGDSCHRNASKCHQPPPPRRPLGQATGWGGGGLVGFFFGGGGVWVGTNPTEPQLCGERCLPTSLAAIAPRPPASPPVRFGSARPGPAGATFRAGGGSEVGPGRRGGARRRNQWLGRAV